MAARMAKVGEMRNKIIKLFKSGKSALVISKALKCSQSNVSFHLRKVGLAGRKAKAKAKVKVKPARKVA